MLDPNEYKHKIKVIDAICGAGKTESAINYINNAEEDKHFLYITPFLTEVERIKRSCSSKNFYEPQSLGTKLNGIRDLLVKGKNIVSTHSLFSQFNQEMIELAYLNNYILIMDEVHSVVEPLNISQFDLKDILDNYTTVDKDGKLIWIAEDYKGEFEKYKKLCDLECLTVYNNTIFLWVFPISIFKAFKEVYILTYMFEAQIQSYYYKYYKVPYEYLYVKDFKFTEEPQTYNIEKYRKLINIYNNEKANNIGDLNYTLSSSWYFRNKESEVMFNELKKKVATFFRYNNSPSTKNMWTCFKDYKDCISGKGYSKGFVSLGSRATNNFIEKDCLAYLSNIYLNPYIKNFFEGKGVQVNEDMYALSELIQWIFRSRIRNQQEITIYIPSKRMRNLLENWGYDKSNNNS